MKETKGYTIGVILGNTQGVLSEEEFFYSIELLMGDDIHYTSHDVISGYTNCLGIDELFAKKQLLQMSVGEKTIEEINVETYVDSIKESVNLESHMNLIEEGYNV